MRKRILLVLVLVTALMLTGGCKLIERDMTVVNNRVVLSFDGVSYTRGQIDALTEEELTLTEMSYAAYGMAFDRTDKANIEEARNIIISDLTRQMVVNAKAEELGCALTEEDMAALQTEAETVFGENLTFFRDNFFAGQDVADEVVAAEMALYGYPASVEETLEVLISEKQEEKLMAVVAADVTVTDEELRSAYDSNVAMQQEDYDTYPAMYESALLYGSPVYYHPEGMRYVKHIFIPFTEEDAAAIAEVTDQIANADETTDVDALNGQVDTLRIAAISNIQTTLDEVKTKLDAGEDFDSLIAAYSADTDSLEEPAKTNGILMYESSMTQWGTTFRDSAMALAAPGDISLPVITDSGVHYILFVSEVTPGPVPFEDVKDALRDETLYNKQLQVYEAEVTRWIDEADITVNRDALK